MHRFLKAVEPAAAAAYFSSWFGGVAVALHDFVSRNKAPDFSLGNITVQLYPVDNYYRFSFQVGEWHERDAPLDPKERDRWRVRMLTDFYGKTVRPLFEAASVAAGIHPGQLSAQLPHKFYYFIDRLAIEDVSKTRERAAEDYRCLKALDAGLFGLKKNPFDVNSRMIESLEGPDKQVPLKSGCCLFYKTEGGQYCYTCPRMKEQERDALRKNFRAERHAG